ncbi:MAG: siderophore-interacting protein [Pseudomonadota bacterium]
MARTPRLLSVVRANRITPNMIRVTLTSPELADVPDTCAGAHCKIMIPTPGETRSSFAARLAGEGHAPVRRTYTVRHARPAECEIDIDFVAHGDEGPASAWAERAASGDLLGFAGPADPKLTQFDADWYLIAADMSALPVAAASLEALPREARGVALFEITEEADRQPIDAPAGVEQIWMVHADPHVPSTAQEDYLRDIAWPEGRVRTMIAGETGVVRALRHLARAERGVDRKAAYASGYWRIGLAEDEHQKVKRAEADADERLLRSA